MSAIFTMFQTLRQKSRFLFRNFSTNLRHKNRFVRCSILLKRTVLSKAKCCFVILLLCRLQTLIKPRASQLFSRSHFLKMFSLVQAQNYSDSMEVTLYVQIKTILSSRYPDYLIYKTPFGLLSGIPYIKIHIDILHV